MGYVAIIMAGLVIPSFLLSMQRQRSESEFGEVAFPYEAIPKEVLRHMSRGMYYYNRKDWAHQTIEDGETLAASGVAQMFEKFGNRDEAHKGEIFAASKDFSLGFKQLAFHEFQDAQDILRRRLDEKREQYKEVGKQYDEYNDPESLLYLFLKGHRWQDAMKGKFVEEDFRSNLSYFS